MTQYATIADLQISGIPQSAFGNLSPIQLNGALVRASAIADSFLRDRYHLPLAEPFDPALSDAVCQVAAYRLMILRGYNQENGDAALRQGYEDAMAWFTRIAKGQATLLVFEASPVAQQPQVISSTPMGWDDLGIQVSGTGNWGV